MTFSKIKIDKWSGEYENQYKDIYNEILIWYSEPSR